jgi:hypothetical protein
MIIQHKNYIRFFAPEYWYLMALEILLQFDKRIDRHTIQPEKTADIVEEVADYYPHQLFPHHWGVIKKIYRPKEDERPDWMTIQYNGKDINLQATELDRLYASEKEAVGVRFGSLTSYLLLDIDFLSKCHPNINRSEWNRLLKTLETIGLLNPIKILSSDSGGRHIYYWFNNREQLDTFKVAQLLWSVCHAHGFDIKQGNIEIFPHCKKFTPTPSSYNGHRLPLQPNSGSVLLDDDEDGDIERWDILNPWGEFCQRVQNSQQDMALLRKKIAWGVKYHQEHNSFSSAGTMTTTAAEWLKNLDDRLQLGWTDKGQTNELIRTACVREWVFTSDGERNDDAVLKRLINMPGYFEHCGHQHEIELRVRDWMTCVINAYWPYSRQDMRHGRPILKSDAILDPNNPPPEPQPKSSKRQDDVLARLRQTVAALVDRPLPTKINEIVRLIQEKAKEMFGKGFGINTLYRSKYAVEWRVLVANLQTEAQQAPSHIVSEPETTKKSPSNPDTKSTFSHLILMKVGNLMRISIINFLSNIASEIESISNTVVNRSEDFIFESEPSIETGQFISFTNGHPSAGAVVTDINFPNQSFASEPSSEGQQLSEHSDSSASLTEVSIPIGEIFEDFDVSDRSIPDNIPEPQSIDSNPHDEIQHLVPEQLVDRLEATNQPFLEGAVVSDFFGDRSATVAEQETDESTDEEWPDIGDYLRRLPIVSGGKSYPELIARVVSTSGLGWQLECAEGKLWACPFNMVGETWVFHYSSE